MPTNRLNVVICSFPVGSCYTTITHAQQYSATYTDLEFYDSSAKSRILTLAPFCWGNTNAQVKSELFSVKNLNFHGSLGSRCLINKETFHSQVTYIIIKISYS